MTTKNVEENRIWAEKVNTSMQTSGEAPVSSNRTTNQNSAEQKICSGLCAVLKVCKKWLACQNIYTEEGFLKRDMLLAPPPQED